MESNTPVEMPLEFDPWWKKMKTKASTLFNDHPSIKPFVIALLILVPTLVILDFWRADKNPQTFWDNVLIEAHGLLLDVVLFGIVILLYERKVVRKKEDLYCKPLGFVEM